MADEKFDTYDKVRAIPPKRRSSKKFDAFEKVLSGKLETRSVEQIIEDATNISEDTYNKLDDLRDGVIERNILNTRERGELCLELGLAYLYAPNIVSGSKLGHKLLYQGATEYSHSYCRFFFCRRTSESASIPTLLRCRKMLHTVYRHDYLRSDALDEVCCILKEVDAHLAKRYGEPDPLSWPHYC